MRKIILVILISLLSFNIYSQCIKGKITNPFGEPISYATVYATDVSTGTTSNIEGNYTLDLPKGTHNLTIRYLGYKTKEIEVSCTSTTQKLDIILEEQLYKIPEVRILASGEDPAYSIMRKAIAMRYYYLNQAEEYNCRIYLKGSGKFISIPRLMRKTLKKEGIEEGGSIVMENITDLHFKLPDIVEQNTISMRSTMKGNDASPMGYVTLSLYNDIDGIISPLSNVAFANYKFQLAASFYDQDYLIHKIKIIPRHKGYDLYSGYIYIVEGFWHLHSAELEVEQKLFKIKINQVYAPVDNDVWMPISHNFDIEVGTMGFEIKFKYIASVSDYKVILNSKLDHSVYRKLLADSKESANELNEVIQEQRDKMAELIQKDYITKKESRELRKLVKKDVSKTIPKKKDLEIKDNNNVEDSALLRSVVYWDSIRPIPLTIDELDSYKDKDSIQLRMETDTTYKDSLEREDKRFKWMDLLFGGHYNFDGGHNFSYGGLVDLSHINFNTVDGLKCGMDFRYSHNNDSTGKYFSISQNADYAFSREQVWSNISVYYRYNGLKRASIRMSGGRKISDFDSRTGITENLNMITTLFLKENYLKLYQKDYINFGHNIDIANGLNVFTDFEYAQRKELFNNSNFYFYDPYNNNYTSNTPPINNFNPNLVKDNNASILSVSISYTPEYYYRINNGVKWNTSSRFPTFRLNYKKGIKNLFNSDADFDQLELSINHGLNIKRLGGISYKLTAGSFLNSNSLYFADYKHFGTNKPFLIGSSESDIFRLLDYYDYSTNSNYFEGHIELENDRLLLKRLPILNKTLMRESVYFNYLATSGNKPYYEFGYGLNQIFLMFNVEVFAGFRGSTLKYTGIKIGIPFVGRSGTSLVIGG